MPVSDVFKTGNTNPESAIYYCKECGNIIPLSKGERFPPCHGGAGIWVNVGVAGVAEKEKIGISKPAPKSGLYLCTGCHAQVIPLSKGNRTPPCGKCRKNTAWRLVIHA